MIMSLLQLTAVNALDSSFSGTAVFEGGLKIMFVIGFGLYSIFAFVVTRQVSNMRRTLSTSASLPIRLTGYIHLFTSVILFFAALLIL